jgi:hypothetical protein
MASYSPPISVAQPVSAAVATPPQALVPLIKKIYDFVFSKYGASLATLCVGGGALYGGAPAAFIVVMLSICVAAITKCFFQLNVIATREPDSKYWLSRLDEALAAKDLPWIRGILEREVRGETMDTELSPPTMILRLAFKKAIPFNHEPTMRLILEQWKTHHLKPQEEIVLVGIKTMEAGQDPTFLRLMLEILPIPAPDLGDILKSVSERNHLELVKLILQNNNARGILDYQIRSVILNTSSDDIAHAILEKYSSRFPEFNTSHVRKKCTSPDFPKTTPLYEQLVAQESAQKQDSKSKDEA